MQIEALLQKHGRMQSDVTQLEEQGTGVKEDDANADAEPRLLTLSRSTHLSMSVSSPCMQGALEKRAS